MTELMPFYGTPGRPASSFIAPNVDEWGRVLSVATDEEAERLRRIRQLELAQKEMELQDMARQFAARAALQEDVAAGVPFEEAFRRRAPQLTSDLRILAQLASEPDVRRVNGVTMARTGTGTWRPVRDPVDTEELRTLRDELDDVRRQRDRLLGKTLPGPDDEQRIAELEGRESAIMGRIAERTEGSRSAAMLPETAVPDLTRQPPDAWSALQEQWNAMAQPGSQLQLSRRAMDARNAPGLPSAPPPAEPDRDAQAGVERIKQQYKAGQLTRAEAERALKALGLQ